MNKKLLLIPFLIFIASCSNLRDATKAHDYTNQAKSSVDKNIETIKSYMSDEEKVSIKLAPIPDPHDFLNEPVSLVINDLNYNNISQILPTVILRDVRFDNDLVDPELPAGSNPLSLNYSGSLSGLLNSVCFQLKCSWQVTNDLSIYLSRYQTKFWRIPVLPIDRTSNTSIASENKYGSSGSGGGAGGGGEGFSQGGGGESSSFTGQGGQTVTSDFTYKASETIASIIEPLIGDIDDDSGESWSYSAQTGLLSVTASNQKIESIDFALNELKRYLTAQVQFNIKIISYDESETENYGIDWNLVWERMGELGVTADIGTSVDAGSDQIGFNVLESNEPFSGTQAFINALSEFATISSTKDFNYSTLSNQVLPFHLAEEIPFNVIETQIVPNAGVTQSYTIYNKSVGLHMNLLPVILTESELMMEFKFSLSNLTDFLEIDLGQNGSARIPQTKVNEAIQQVMLKSGESVVLSGFSIDDAAISKRSPVKAKFWAFGGSKNEERSKSSLVIVVTPKIKI
jgi:type IVB pilus formation R64 PilN family outer membrane protein